jgi:hypothetical protein
LESTAKINDLEKAVRQTHPEKRLNSRVLAGAQQPPPVRATFLF